MIGEPGTRAGAAQGELTGTLLHPAVHIKLSDMAKGYQPCVPPHNAHGNLISPWLIRTHFSLPREKEGAKHGCPFGKISRAAGRSGTGQRLPETPSEKW